MITRRHMSAAGLGLLASKLARGAGRLMHPLRAQLYTVRNIMPTAAEPTLKSIAEIGYREVETDHASVPRIAPILNNYGLKPVSCRYHSR